MSHAPSHAYRLGAALLASLLLLGPLPLLAASRPKAAPNAAPQETPAPPSQPAGPSPEICAKVRESRTRSAYYLKQSLAQSRLELLAAQQELVYAKMGYRPFQIQGLMAGTYRDLEQSRRVVQDAKASSDRLADDPIGKVETPWPACAETPSR
jgi:hypothetical protein